MKKILIVDGDYFAHRCLSTLNMGESVNNLETDIEKRSFKAMLNQQLVNLWTNVGGIFDNIIFVSDNNSWRKKAEPHIPYYHADKTDVVFGYKENRKAKKDDSDINYTNFKEVANEFIESLKSYMLVFDSEGLEGDDNIMLLAREAGTNEKLKNHIFVILGTDGDIEQAVAHNNVIYYRNAKSKDLPNGEMIITKALYEKLYKAEPSAMSILTGTSTWRNDFFDVFSMNIYDSKRVERNDKNMGVRVAQPIRLALEKCIGGDKKDNIFSVVGWMKGTSNYSVTEKMIEKAFAKVELEFNDATATKAFNDKVLFESVIKNVIDVTKQKDVDYEKVVKHFNHNLRMKMLTPSLLPNECVDGFKRLFESCEDSIVQGAFDSIKLKKVDVSRKDAATNLMHTALPDGLI